MTGLAIALCVIFLAASFWLGRKSLVAGLITTLTVGYFYGILRANIPSPASHFFFDAALLGLYASQKWTPLNAEEARDTQFLRSWLLVLILWPVILCLLPFQTLMVSLVGLRGNIFFLPVLLLAARLDRKGWLRLAYGLAGLALVAAGFGAAEYYLGVPRFFPENEVTLIIYRSKDVAGFSAYRIPAIFANAHAYAGSMTSSLPFMLAAWLQKDSGKWAKLLLVAGIVAAMMGVLMASTRVNFLIAAILVVAATFIVKMRPGLRFIWMASLAAIVVVALSNERFQRFKSIESVDVVSDRLAGSVNRSFLEVMFEYPMGNGLGGGGTSIPFFLASEVRKPVAIESEYGRVLLEQGIIGFVIFVAFLFWVFTRKQAWSDPQKRIAWLCCVLYAVAAAVGTGFMTAIPQTMLVLMGMGFIVTPRRAEESRPRYALWVPGPSPVVERYRG